MKSSAISRLAEATPLSTANSISADFSQAQKDAIRAQVERDFPETTDPRDDEDVQLPCLRSRDSHIGWFNDVAPFMADDYELATPAVPRVDDRVVYVKSGEPQHSGVVTMVTGSGTDPDPLEMGQRTGVYSPRSRAADIRRDNLLSAAAHGRPHRGC